MKQPIEQFAENLGATPIVEDGHIVSPPPLDRKPAVILTGPVLELYREHIKPYMQQIAQIFVNKKAGIISIDEAKQRFSSIATEMVESFYKKLETEE